MTTIMTVMKRNLESMESQSLNHVIVKINVEQVNGSSGKNADLTPSVTSSTTINIAQNSGNGNTKFYLHEAEIIEAVYPILTKMSTSKNLLMLTARVHSFRLNRLKDIKMLLRN